MTCNTKQFSKRNQLNLYIIVMNIGGEHYEA